MKKISILASTLLLASFLVIIDMSRSKVVAKPTYRKEMVYMNILLAILNDPDFLSMSYPEQYKILDGFYNHVKIYLKEEEREEKEQTEKEEEKEKEDDIAYIDLKENK